MNDESAHPKNRQTEIQRYVDRLCDDIETRWSRNEAVDLVDIVENLDSETVPVFLNEIAKLEVEVRNRDFISIRNDYLEKLPELSDLIAEIFQTIDYENGTGTTIYSSRLIVDSDTQPIFPDFVGKKIGEYFVEKKLGGGGFGVVFLGRDAFLPRKVVIKIPTIGRHGTPAAIEYFLDEARNAALLNHPNVLRVLHVGVDSGLPYIIQEYFEGGDLSQLINLEMLSVNRTIAFVAKIAGAMGYAHQNRIIHRDLKPANILINTDGEPVIADFGLSLYEPQLRGKVGEMVGTIRFMSPEQVRGEAHRLDGRTDIWSIGVILYLMLANQYPFNGNNIEDIGQAILFGRPCPPRQLNHQISPELERICLKCLATRVNDRYSTAFDLRADLEAILESGGQIQTTPVLKGDPLEKKHLIPKGLAAFDGTDRDFFLDLLPGPKDRNGIPDSIRFWKDRIENEELSTPVGLLFGPSGCGKSSLVSAGLIPVLQTNIVVVAVESTAEDTEVRVLQAIRSKIPSVPLDISLPDLIAEIRRGEYLPSNQRMLLVFDQFEQWLHANEIDEHSQLIHALRQCDGRRIQSLVLAREDFWMAITRFFKQLDIELVERKNFACVDLFSKRHARNVLVQFGQAYGNLAEDSANFSKSQNLFLDKAVDLLAEKDSVICVRSALFAETVKNKDWELETIKQIGDSKNIGVAFLDQAIGSKSTNPKYRFHRQPIITILEELLPDPGVEIKGGLKSTVALANVVRLDVEDSDFKEIIRILDKELRLITPTEPDTGFDRSDSSDKSFYQLTHDYLVPSLRDWISSFRCQTRKGRAKQRLSELSLAWQQNKQNQFLPGFFEYGSILWHVPRSHWRKSAKAFMQRSNLYYGLRLLLVSVIVALMVGMLWQSSGQRRKKEILQVVNIIKSGPASFLDSVESVSNPIRIRSLLKEQLALAESAEESGRIRLGLTLLGDKNPDHIRFIIEHIESFENEDSIAICKALQSDPPKSIVQLKQKILESRDAEKAKLQILLAFLYPESIPKEVFSVRKDLVHRSVIINCFRSWHGEMSRCVDLLENNQEPHTLALLFICLGQFSIRDFDQVTSNKLIRIARDHYENHPSSDVHSASQWALNRWGQSDALSPVDNIVNQWCKTKMGLTMIRIKAGTIPNRHSSNANPDVVKTDFLISSHEVSGDLFNQFLQESDHNREYWDRHPIAKNMPAAYLHFDDAILFCNWLSIAEDRECCYTRNDKDSWKLSIEANGYRLPLNPEWELAARGGPGGVSTDYFFDVDPEIAGRYVWYDANSSNQQNGVRFHPTGLTIPGPNGLFDVLGNVAEICWGKVRIEFEIPAYVARGGSIISGISDCRLSFTSIPLRFEFPVNENGLRVVRTAD